MALAPTPWRRPRTPEADISTQHQTQHNAHTAPSALKGPYSAWPFPGRLEDALRGTRGSLRFPANGANTIACVEVDAGARPF